MCSGIANVSWVLIDISSVRSEEDSERKWLYLANVENKSGNYHVMQRWSDESGCKMRLPLGALICRGQGKASETRCSGAINEQVSDSSRALSRLPDIIGQQRQIPKFDGTD